MTTIVFCNKTKQIAVDSRTTSGGIVATDSAIKYKKVGEIVYFFAGYAGEKDLFIDQFEPLKDANKNLDVIALRVEKQEVYLMTCGNGVFRECRLDHNEGIGSGCDFALAALDSGKSAKETVEYASTKNIYTGGEVHVYDVNKMEFL